ncbi:MAG: hypothetical protein QXJ62_06490 [Nitrososphaeria archaeon]
MSVAEHIQNVARMLQSITFSKGRFDLTDNLKRSRNYEEFSDAIYNALRVAQTIQIRGAYAYIVSENDLKKVLEEAKNKEKFSELKNTIACLALSYFPFPKTSSEVSE